MTINVTSEVFYTVALTNCNNLSTIWEHHIPLLTKFVPQAAGVKSVSDVLQDSAATRPIRTRHGIDMTEIEWLPIRNVPTCAGTNLML